MRRKRAPRTDDTTVDLTPMLDVVFILLIFFIVTASFVKEAGLEVNRQYASSAEPQDTGNVLIAISPEGDVWIDKRRVDVRAVRANIERLHAENPQGAVVVQADKDSKNGVLVQVLDAARQAGVENVSIAAEVDR
jgi:biopolymer transport protein ExbD